jgi:hypothetical protein
MKRRNKPRRIEIIVFTDRAIDVATKAAAEALERAGEDYYMPADDYPDLIARDTPRRTGARA